MGDSTRLTGRRLRDCGRRRTACVRQRRAGRWRARRWPTALLAAALLAAAVALPGGCGYAPDVPRLPAGAHSVGVARVANLTDTGELDVRLHRMLLRALQQRASVQLLPPERAALTVEVTLTTFTITRTLDPTITTDRSFGFALSGTVTVTDQRTRRRLITDHPLSAAVTRLHAPTVLETPAIRDEGTNDVLAAFAVQVERLLFTTF